jgi:hypothetical protein
MSRPISSARGLDRFPRSAAIRAIVAASVLRRERLGHVVQFRAVVLTDDPLDVAIVPRPGATMGSSCGLAVTGESLTGSKVTLDHWVS